MSAVASVLSVSDASAGPVAAAWQRVWAKLWANVGPCSCVTGGWGLWRGAPLRALAFGAVACVGDGAGVGAGTGGLPVGHGCHRPG